MNKDTIEGNWKEFKGKPKHKRGKLIDDTDYDVDRKRHEPDGRRQKRFGVTRYEAEKQVRDLESRF